jgi:flavin-dependent dehydrogenase
LRTTVAPSFQLDTVAGDGWVAVGDAASAYDPISSQGVYKALADGLRAGSALATHLAGDATSLAQYRAALAGRFDGYLAQRNHFYGVERRWPEASFWRKRRSRSRAQQ